MCLAVSPTDESPLTRLLRCLLATGALSEALQAAFPASPPLSVLLLTHWSSPRHQLCARGEPDFLFFGCF